MPLTLIKSLQLRFGLGRPAAPIAGTTSTQPARDGWTAAEWARVRAPERHRDRELSRAARRWLDHKLPTDAVPHALVERFPRIVNRLAALWRDAGLTETLLHELLTDTRGDRQGFPPPIVDELKVLLALHEARVEATETADDQWPVTSPS